MIITTLRNHWNCCRHLRGPDRTTRHEAYRILKAQKVVAKTTLLKKAIGYVSEVHIR